MKEWKTLSRSDVLHIHSSGAAVWIELCRPEVMNAFDSALQDELTRAIEKVGTDTSVRAVMLSGQGNAFSAGADLNLDASTSTLRSRTYAELTQRYNPIVRGIRTMPKPVVAAVNGPAVGVGCAIAVACDQVIAASSSSFMLAFAKVGLTVDGGASLIVGARIGLGRATRMAMLGERVDASQALEWGLVDEVVAGGDLMDRSASLVETFATGPTAAYARTKRNLGSALLPELDAALSREADAQSELVDAYDFREGAAAFAERRRPQFRGE